MVTRSGLADDLGKLGLGAVGVVMVHCRLSALGRVVGGAEVVVRALFDVLGSGGTLVAYTGWQDAPPYARLVELGGQVAMLGAPLDTDTLVHHAEAIADVSDKRRVVYRYPVFEGGQRIWRTFSDIDTSEGALPYERVVGDEDYVGYLARSALAAGCGKSGLVGEATAYLFDAPQLVEHAVGWIEQNFSFRPPGDRR